MNTHYPNSPLLKPNCDGPLERAQQYVSEQNSRRISMAYGRGALLEVRGAFGRHSDEFHAFRASLVEAGFLAIKQNGSLPWWLELDGI